MDAQAVCDSCLGALLRGVERRARWEGKSGNLTPVQNYVDGGSMAARNKLANSEDELEVEGSCSEVSNRGKLGGQDMLCRGRESKVGEVGGQDDGVGHENINKQVIEDAGSETKIEGIKPNSDQRLTQEIQSTENMKTWKLATESGAVFYDDEEDIMAILQRQNEAIATKRRMAKQKEKARKSRPKQHNKSEKLVMWEELSYMVGLCQVSFCFMGDFNEILRLEERKDAVSLPASAEDFMEWVQDLQLIDLPLTDRKFTWFRGKSCSCIDRMMVSLEWLEEFPDTRLKGGPRGQSDHCPLILEDTRLWAGTRPFRSLDSWFTHEGFLRMVKDEWKNLGDDQFTNKLKALRVLLRRWHKDNFGDMNSRIKKFEEEIKKIDDIVSAGSYDKTMEARRKALVTCCAKWYARKEIRWKQMSRSQHARYMDKNTSIRDGLVKQIEEEEAAVLEVMPTPEEIREAVWDCESSKTPGSDGYNMNFIKKCWDEIGQEFTTTVLGFFQSAKLPTEANVTWVALAPKFVGAKKIKDLRPINMVGCIYKVISKVLVRRMRLVMPCLVGETQSAFVKGRKIHDGALIACETVQWLKLRRKRAAIIKLDFQKAYDRVRWSFVDIVLQKMGFELRWRTWVKECVTTASMSVLINGSPSKPFKMERGLRQGDPLSPFLFVLVVDVLHRMVGEAVRNGRISPLLVGQDNIELSHLQFADDTILFCPQDMETVLNYKRLLRCFELMSGLSINYDKSSLISVNCEKE
ncbi:uncharacterized protein [Arachis hypogaea]|uniref:uncharacterized protein n=1 Tax=Arachis hypogaea TaxID=3818 RepID=UPI000DEC5391|nr:uncharacterized protein LOC112733737 [Arachis hypogaea]